MAIQLRLSPSQIVDLAKIGDLDPQLIQRVVDHLQSIRPLPLRPTELINQIKAAVNGEIATAELLSKQAVVLHGVMRQGTLNSSDVFDALCDQLAVAAKWQPEKLDQFRRVKSQFCSLLSSEAVKLVATAIDLSYEYANLLRRARIITDIRPIFDVAAEKINGAVVSHTLRIRYDNTEGNHDLSLAMDAKDIDDLRRECERALKKAKTAKSLMAEEAKVQTMISGGDTDA